MSRHDKPKIDARAIIARLNKESAQVLQREIIAPLLPGGKIRTRVSGMVYEFKPRGNLVGWGRFRPLNEREAEWIDEAHPWERGRYLELFPALRMVLLWPDPTSRRPGTWLALPFNESDAQTRFGLAMEPQPVYLCDPANGADRFERVIVRVDGKTLWLDGPDMLADPTHAEWLREATTRSEMPETFLPGLAGSERTALLFGQIRQLELGSAATHQTDEGQPPIHSMNNEVERLHRMRRRPQQRTQLRQEWESNQLEARLRHALAKADAVFHSYQEIPSRDGSPGNLVVEWSEHGQTYRYRSTVDRNLSVVSSGICLSERDSDFDLTSVVNVITDAESEW